MIFLGYIHVHAASSDYSKLGGGTLNSGVNVELVHECDGHFITILIQCGANYFHIPMQVAI